MVVLAVLPLAVEVGRGILRVVELIGVSMELAVY